MRLKSKLMQTFRQDSVQLSPASQPQTIAISATFTAEPLEESLIFWMKQLKMSASIEFAPYNQVFQQLLDPTSVFAQNRQGVNVVLLRFEDWCRDKSENTEEELAQAIDRNLQELIVALQAAVAQTATPYIVCLCPDSPTAQANLAWVNRTQQWHNQLVTALGQMSGVYFLQWQDLQAYPVEDFYDSQRDKLGHIPYTPMFFTALGTSIARRIYAIKSAPHKVIVLDCDNTIWKGVVGEDGVMGVEITPAYRALQEFMIAQQNAGMILCFCSKNNEPDVLEVFEKRPEMPLKLGQVVAWRINWLPKSENIKSLAQELNLGLDSFIFIDDNPVECAEVKTNCPEVLTLQLPVDGDIPQFLQHVWAFDRLKVTEEDKQRTHLYKQNLERERFQQQSLSITDFLAGLELNVDISEPTPAQMPRVAQLTQRTNQFNFSTVRRSDSEIQQLAQSGLECRIVEVRDRFGDYGLVGVMIFGTDASALNIDTFLLSCRVLGRGVEHQMLNHLAKIAEERQLSVVNADFIPTKKNLPARNFLESVAAEFKQSLEQGDRFAIPVATAATIAYQPTSAPIKSADESPAKSALSTSTEQRSSKSEQLGRIAVEFNHPGFILAAIAAERQTLARSVAQPYVAPQTEVEIRLAQLWAELLGLEMVGIQDNYFDLGGTSLLSVELFAQVETRFGKKLPLTALVEAPTVEQLAKLISQSKAMDSLVLIRAGGAKPPLFLVHDGDGETLLYRNLAQRLHPDHPVYGLQPYAQAGYPMLHTRISEMAAYHIGKIRTVQPHGPYLLGGMCAGGVIAFEIAQQLQQSGETVALVALIDAADVAASKRVGLVAGQRLKSFASAFSAAGQSLPLHQRLGTIVTKVSQKVKNLVAYETQSRFLNLQNTIQMNLLQYYVDKGLTLPQFLQNLSVRQVYSFAEQGHSPNGVLQGEVVLFRATVGTGPLADQPWIEVYSDPLFGWGKRVTGGVKVFDIPGGHASMLQEPNVQVLAEQMQVCIDAVLGHAAAERVPTLTT